MFNRLKDYTFTKNHLQFLKTADLLTGHIHTRESYATFKAQDKHISLTANASDRLEDYTFTKNLQSLKTVDLSRGHTHTLTPSPLHPHLKPPL